MHFPTSLRMVVLAVSLAGSAPLAAAVAYPGPAPGVFQCAVGDGALTVSNQALAVSWRLDGTGLRPGWRCDAPGRADQTRTLTGEVFRITRGDGSRWSASSLRRAGEAVVRRLTPDPRSSRFAGRLDGRVIEVPLRSADEALQIVWRVLAVDGANYLRTELELVAQQADVVLREIEWLGEPLAGAASAGSVDGSPLVAGDFFFGYEDPMALNETLPIAAGTGDAGGVRAHCRLRRDATLRRGETLTQSFVIGVTPPGQRRRGFLHYLERERAHPYRPFLHYNSWYDIAWAPFALHETNCLEAIDLFGERFIRRHGVAMDSMVFDDGWDDPQTLWQFHAGFPRGFAPHAERCREYGTRLGVWLSPFGGYGEPRAQRLRYGHAQGYETNAAGFSLAGPKYYAAFRDACLRMIERYGANSFKFDGIASGMMASGAGAAYLLDTEAMRRLMLELRRAEPDLYINLTTGSWPSPFWLRYADSLWRQGGDMGFAGKGNPQQQWLNYRDQQTYRNIVQRGPLYPLNALMTQGVAYSRQGDAGRAEFNSAGFKDDVRAFFASGTSLQELYLQPDKLTDADWQVLAEAAQWSRAHADVLVDTHWLGGDPAQHAVYGWAAWTARRGLVSLRNPDDQPHTFELDVGSAFELPPGAPTRYRLRSPWAEDAAAPPRDAEAGRRLPIALRPFQVVTFEAEPVR